MAFYFSSLKELVLSGTNMSEANDWVKILHKLPYLTYLQLIGCDLPDVGPLPIFLTNSSKSLSQLDLHGNNLFCFFVQMAFQIQ